MYDFLEIVVRIFQVIILIFMLGALALIPLAGLYLLSGDFRHLITEFEEWTLRRRIKRALKDDARHRQVRVGEFFNTNEYRKMQGYVEYDNALVVDLYGHMTTRHNTIFEEVVADHNVDPLEEKRLAKEQDAADSETIDRAQEYYNGIA